MTARIAAGGLLAVALLFLYAPLVTLILYSFNESRLVAVWGGWSARWYGALWQDEALLSAAWLSVRVAAATATLAVVMGALIARASLVGGRLAPPIILLAGLPLALPEVILGLSLLLLAIASGGVMGWPGDRGIVVVVLAHATFAAAYAAVVVRAGFERLDPALDEAALDLGATGPVALVTVVLPALAPALAAAWLMAFALSLDDLVVAGFVAGPGATTLPLEVFSRVRLGVTPEVNALATLLLVVVTLALVLAARLGRLSRR